jgi:hypothetical protein
VFHNTFPTSLPYSPSLQNKALCSTVHFSTIPYGITFCKIVLFRKEMEEYLSVFLNVYFPNPFISFTY